MEIKAGVMLSYA